MQDGALDIIASAADGGMRDALSLLDQAVSFSGEELTVDDAPLITGAVSQHYIGKLASTLHEKMFPVLWKH